MYMYEGQLPYLWHQIVLIKSIVLENDPANLRLLEAFYIRKYKPTMNSREECSEFADLLF